MAKEEAIQMEGTVTETLPNTMFRVELEKRSQCYRPHLRKNAKTLHPHYDWRRCYSRTDTIRFRKR